MTARPALTLATIRPGPVLHVFRDGQEIAAIPLSRPAATRLAFDILRALLAVDTAPEGAKHEENRNGRQ
ncbi:MAG: hypothetical protein R3D84_15525 [Paracoccaceae bacterium]